MTADVERRVLLRLLLGAASAAFASAGEAAMPAADAVAALLACFRHKESAAVVGRAYLEGLAELPDRARLAAVLLDGWWGDAAGETVAAFVRRRLDEDFTRGALVEVDGWMLAETEAKLCALAALAGEAA